MKIFSPKLAHLALGIAFTIFFSACATQNNQATLSSMWLNDAMSDVCWSVESSAQCEEILQTACESGDYRKCALLGYTYTKHLNVPTSDYRAKEDKAVALFKKACDGGDGSGCFALGMLQANDALKVKGCEYGDSSACSHIVANRDSETRIEMGDGVQFVPKFEPKIVRWALEREIELLKDECKKADLRLQNERDKDRIISRQLVLVECENELQKAQGLNLDADSEKGVESSKTIESVESK